MIPVVNLQLRYPQILENNLVNPSHIVFQIINVQPSHFSNFFCCNIISQSSEALNITILFQAALIHKHTWQ